MLIAGTKRSSRWEYGSPIEHRHVQAWIIVTHLTCLMLSGVEKPGGRGGTPPEDRVRVAGGRARAAQDCGRAYPVALSRPQIPIKVQGAGERRASALSNALSLRLIALLARSPDDDPWQNKKQTEKDMHHQANAMIRGLGHALHERK